MKIQTSQAVTYDPATDEFSVKVVSIPHPGAGDVLVKVNACALNPVDAKIHLWHGIAPGMNADWVPGLDVSGEIVAVGEAVQDWQVGERVLYHGDMFRPHGGFAEYAIHRAETLVPHPDVDSHVAAATPCAGWTAWRALVDKLHVAEHQAIFIGGGSGGVGSFAIQIARHFGLKQIITSCSAANQAFVLGLGATHVIDYRQQDPVTRVLEITAGQGVPVALDTVGGNNDILTANLLGFEGQMVELVQTVRPEHYNDAFMKGLSFHQLSLGAGHRNGPAAAQDLVDAGTAFSKLLETGEIQVPRLETIRLSEVGDALLLMREQRTVGKVVMVN